MQRNSTPSPRPAGLRGRGTAAALLASTLLVAPLGCGRDRGATAAVEPVPPGPPVALAMLASNDQVLRSPVEFFVTLPQRWPARAVLVDSAGRAVGAPVAARWTSSDTTIVRVDAEVAGVTELTALRTGEARVTATYGLAADTVRLTTVWHVQR